MNSAPRHLGAFLAVLFCSLSSLPAQDAAPAADPAFVAELAKTRAEALKQYPDLANPASPLSKRCALLEQQMKEDGNPVLTRAGHPLVIAHRAAADLGIKAKEDSIFKEVLPTFTTATGTMYKSVTVTSIQKDGIGITHENGAIKIPYLELTNDQREKYGLRPNAPSSALVTSDLPTVIQKTIGECEKSIAAMVKDIDARFAPRLAETKFGFDREYIERMRDRDLEGALRGIEAKHAERLTRSAALAKELGDTEALAMLDEEFRVVSKDRIAKALDGIPERNATRNASYAPIRALITDNVFTFLIDGKPKFRRQFEKGGKFGEGRWSTLSADHIRIYPTKGETISWCFKVDVKAKTGTLVRDASTGNYEGAISFRLAY